MNSRVVEVSAGVLLRDGENDRMENEGQQFQARVRRGLMELAGRRPERVESPVLA